MGNRHKHSHAEINKGRILREAMRFEDTGDSGQNLEYVEQ